MGGVNKSGREQVDATIVGDVPLAADAATETTLANRFAGGLTPYAAVLTASATITPAAGKYLKVKWVSFIPNPDNVAANLVTIGFAAGSTLYVGYAMAHWEMFVGSVNQVLNITLGTSEPVAVTIHYQEV